MKRSFIIVSLFFCLMCGNIFSAEFCNYTNGVTGIKTATIPPPGEYYLLYHIYYHSDQFKNQLGKDNRLNYNLSVFAQVHRFVWITNKKIFGADFGLDIAIPYVYQNIKIEDLAIKDSMSGLGDLCIEPFILAWHKDRYDLVFGFGGYVPSGRFDLRKNASVGKDRYTGMLGAGGTFYFDKARSWSLSMLHRFETHAEERKTRVRPGNDFHFEWGIGKKIARKWIWEIGATGYCQWQITDDTGIQATSLGVRDRVFAAGPEINVFIPKAKINVSLRNNWEFNAHDRPEGTITVLTISKVF